MDAATPDRWAGEQLIEANFGIFSANAHGGGVAFFAHVGGFLFGFVVTLLAQGRGLTDTGDRAPKQASA